MPRILEILTYTVHPDSRAEFDRLVREKSLPMLRRWKVDVVAFGPSLHDEDSYFLLRSYASLAERQASQDAFYGSDEWRSGPREAIMRLIANDTTSVIEIESAALESLRSSR